MTFCSWPGSFTKQDFDLGWGRRTWGCRWWRTKQTLLPPPDFASSCKILLIAMVNINPCLKLGSREISPPQAFYRGSNCLIGLKCNFISSTSTTCHQVSWPISGLGNRMLRVKTPAFYSSRPILKWVNFGRFCSRRVLWISGIRGHYSN